MISPARVFASFRFAPHATCARCLRLAAETLSSKLPLAGSVATCKRVRSSLALTLIGTGDSKTHRPATHDGRQSAANAGARASDSVHA